MLIRRIAFILFVISLIVCTSGNAMPDNKSFGELRDSLSTVHDAEIVAEAGGLGSLNALRSWFDAEAIRLNRELYSKGKGYRLVPVGIYGTDVPPAPENTSLWNFGAEYHLPLNTVNGFLGYFNRYDNLELGVRLLYGSGMTEILDYDSTEVSLNLGVGAELAYNTDSKWLNPLLGLAYMWIELDNDSDVQGSYLYAGNHFYFSDSRDVSLDIKGGVSFWRDFGDETTPPEWFLGGGLTVHRLVDITRVGRPLFGPMEMGLYANPSLEILGSKFMAPMRLRKGLSFAPFGSFGVETGANNYSASYGLGAELRFFGDRVDEGLNPYIGFQQYWVDIIEPDENLRGSSFYFGSRYYLSDYVALDANLGPVFWDEEVENEVEEESQLGLKDWIGKVGVSVAFGKIGENKELHGAILTRDSKWGESRIDEAAFNPLDCEGLNRGDGEVRIYAREERPTQTVKPVGDLSDLKFFEIGLDLGLEFDPFNTKGDLMSGSEAREKNLFIAILFNRKNTLVESLNENNTFFQFVDLDNGQYFGYRWDSNRSRQPEFRRMGMLGVKDSLGGQRYWGSFDEFVRPVRWLNEQKLMDFMDGSDIERKILDMMSRHFAENDTLYDDAPTPEKEHSLIEDYRIAYVEYPQSSIDKIKEYLHSQNLGVAVMVGIDKDRDGLYTLAGGAEWKGTDQMPPSADPGDKVKFDSEDDFFLSNHVKMEEIISDDIVLDHFEECSETLTEEHKMVLENQILPRLYANSGDSILLTGYTDATPMKTDCREKYRNNNQEILGRARAQQVADHLMKRGIKKDRIEVKGIGIKMPAHKYEPRDRCVVVSFR